MRRLIVCHEDEFTDNIDDGIAKVIRQMQDSKIYLKWITSKAVGSFLTIYEAKPIENLLVVDKRWMTRSSGEGHDGQYSISPNLIKKAVEAFDEVLWPRAKELPETFELKPGKPPTRKAVRG